MKLRLIYEFENEPDFNAEEVIEDLQSTIDDKDGYWTEKDKKELEKYLTRFDASILKRIADWYSIKSSGLIVFDIVRAIVDNNIIVPIDGIDDIPDEEEIPSPQQHHTSEINSILANISAAELIDNGLAKLTIPFIYVANDKQVYLGDRDSYHGHIFNINNPQIKDVYQKRAIGIVGRIGINLTILDKYDNNRIPSGISLVAMYARPEITDDMISDALSILLQIGLIKPNFYVSIANDAGLVGEYIDGSKSTKISAEAAKKADLQIALHIGAWPDGRRLTDAERKGIRRLLGMENIGGVKKGWQQASEQQKLIQPGQKWWAMTSEDTKK